MFVSTPGGASGYLVERVKPERLLEPILNVASRSELITHKLLLRSNITFKNVATAFQP
jgi:hypothetical protein